MQQTEDRLTGHQPVTPRRLSPGRWLLVAAAVVVVAVVGALLVVAAGGDDEDTVDAVTSTPTTELPQDVVDLHGLPESEDFVSLEPGRYFVDPDGATTTPLRVTFEVAAEGWSSWIGAAKFDDGGHVALSIAAVTNLVRDGCLDHRPADPVVGATVNDLATALTQLAPFEVSAPPSDVTMFGYSGKHLQLTVPDLPVTDAGGDRRFTDCSDDGSLQSWIDERSGTPFFGYNGEPGRIEDFWILDVDGTRLVLQKNGSPGTPAQDLAERDAIFNSIRIEP